MRGLLVTVGVALALAVVAVVQFTGGFTIGNRTSLDVPSVQRGEPDESVAPPTPETVEWKSCGVGETKCLTEAIYEQVESGGPQQAMSYLDWLAEREPEQAANCHTLHHIVGNATALIDGDLAFVEMDCQYGFVHGLLATLGQRYADIETFIAETVPYCMQYPPTPFGGCGHGIGHAVAQSSPSDIATAVRTCESIVERLAADCASGVLMQFGDDRLIRAGLLSSESRTIGDSSAPLVDDPDIDVATLCTTFSPIVQDACYQRLWIFAMTSEQTVPSLDDIGPVVERTCKSAPTEKLHEACEVGFADVLLQVYFNEVPELKQWAPDTPEEADRYARALASTCAKFPNQRNCVFGVARSTTVTLLQADYPKELVPDLCRYVDDPYRAACDAGLAELRAIAD